MSNQEVAIFLENMPRPRMSLPHTAQVKSPAIQAMLKALDVTVAFRALLLAEVDAQRSSHPSDDLSYEEAENLLIQLSVPTEDNGTPQQCAEALFLQFIEARDKLRAAGFQRPSHSALMRMTS